MMLSRPIADLIGNIFEHTIYSPSVILMAFIVEEFGGEGWGGGESPPPQHNRQCMKTSERSMCVDMI